MRSDLTERTANEALAMYRQVDNCYGIKHCTVTRTYWERVWAAINNWL